MKIAVTTLFFLLQLSASFATEKVLATFGDWQVRTHEGRIQAVIPDAYVGIVFPTLTDCLADMPKTESAQQQCQTAAKESPDGTTHLVDPLDVKDGVAWLRVTYDPSLAKDCTITEIAFTNWKPLKEAKISVAENSRWKTTLSVEGTEAFVANEETKNVLNWLRRGGRVTVTTVLDLPEAIAFEVPARTFTFTLAKSSNATNAALAACQS